MDRDFVAGNQVSLERLRTFIDGASEELLSRAMSDGWTVSAYLAHVAFFDRRISRIADRIASGDFAPSPFDVHVLNDAMKPAWLLIAPADAAAEALAAAEEANSVAAGLSGEVLARVLEEKIFAVDRAHHRNHHLVEFEALPK